MPTEQAQYDKLMAIMAETWELLRQNQRDGQELFKRLGEDRARIEEERVRMQAETKRFEEERKRFEEERKKIEAERKRIEEERKRIEAERELERQRAEEERKRIEAERELERQRAEEERKRIEAERELERQRAEEKWNRYLEERKAAMAKLEKYAAETDRKVNKITDILGLFAEHQVYPAALRLFSEMGWNLSEAAQRAIISNTEGRKVAEVDILLSNSTVAVAIEVKNRLSVDDINDQLTRLEKIQKHPSRMTEKSRLYGAVAAMIADDRVIDYAHKKGLFVIVPSGDTVQLLKPENFHPRYWDVPARNRPHTS